MHGAGSQRVLLVNRCSTCMAPLRRSRPRHTWRGVLRVVFFTAVFLFSISVLLVAVYASRSVKAPSHTHILSITRNTSAPAASMTAAGPAPDENLSLNRGAVSDVRGNLGPPTVLTDPKEPTDWLADRWQAASDMQGTPISGEHWVEIDLGRLCTVSRLVLDWEVALSTHWTFQGRPGPSDAWVMLHPGGDTVPPPQQREAGSTHFLQDVRVPLQTPIQAGSRVDPPSPQPVPPVRWVRLLISHPSTQWGSSLWRIHVWGVPITNGAL